MSTPRLATDFIAIHCTATKPSQPVDEDDIRRWHLERNWADIGYNIVILRDGVIQIGRPIDARGAHVRGFNSRSVGCVLVGGVDENGKPEDNFTASQFDALEITIRFLKHYAPYAKVQGHNEFPGVNKACPSFDVQEWLRRRMPDIS